MNGSEVLEALARGLIQHIEFNEEVETQFEKVINFKLSGLSAILAQKGFSNLSEFEIKEQMLLAGEKYFSELALARFSKQIDRFSFFSLWQVFLISQGVKDNICIYMKDYLKRNLSKQSFRKNYWNILLLLESDLIPRYVSQLYNRKGYGTRYLFSKPISTPKLLEEFLSLSLIFYPLSSDGIHVDGRGIYLEEFIGSTDSLRMYFQHMKKYVASTFGDVPESIFQTGVEASILRSKLKFIPDFHIRSDLVRILLHLVKFRKSQMTASGGNKRADSPEKSLIALFQKQAEFLGLEKNMLYELELVTRENRW